MRRFLPGPFDDEPDRSTGDTGESGLRRRTVLRGLTAVGAAGGLAGCLGTIERDYEATPVGLPAEQARELRYDPDPITRKMTGYGQKDVGVVSVKANLTGYALQYRYQGRSDDGGYRYQVDYVDGDAGYAGADGANGVGTGLLGCGSMPQANVAGQSANPAAGWSVEETVQRRTELIETITGATVPDDPTIDTVTPGQIMSNPQSMVGILDAGFLPESADLLGQSTELRHLLITRASDAGLIAQFLSAGKVNADGDTVFATYLGERTIGAFADGEKPLIGDNGIFTRSQVEAFLDRFIPALPHLARTETVSPDTSTPTDAPTVEAFDGAPVAGSVTINTDDTEDWRDNPSHKRARAILIKLGLPHLWIHGIDVMVDLIKLPGANDEPYWDPDWAGNDEIAFPSDYFSGGSLKSLSGLNCIEISTVVHEVLHGYLYYEFGWSESKQHQYIDLAQDIVRCLCQISDKGNKTPGRDPSEWKIGKEDWKNVCKDTVDRARKKLKRRFTPKERKELEKKIGLIQKQSKIEKKLGP